MNRRGGVRTVRITVKCFASLSEFQPQNAEAFPISEGATLGSVIDGLAIPRKHVHLVFLNNTVRRDLDVTLKDGDVVGVFPPIGGG